MKLKVIQRLLFFLLLFSLSHNNTYSQNSGLAKKFLEGMDLESSLGGQLPTDNTPSANSIDPKHYYLGPGDELSMLLIPQSSKPIDLQVYSDNSLIIPKLNIGVNIKGLTLDDLREKLQLEASNINPNSKVFISVKKAKQCVITVKGNVKADGVFTLPGSMSIASVLKIGNSFETQTGFNPAEAQQELAEKNIERQRFKSFESFGQPEKSEYWKRNVTVLHSDGTSDLLDLELGIATDNPENNPYIMPGDVIILPFETTSYTTVSVLGAVLQPQKLPYKEGDDLQKLFDFGRGLSPNADLDNIRLIQSDGGEKSISIDVEGNVSNNGPLSPGAKLIVGEKKALRSNDITVVSIKGEIRKPGYYKVDQNTSIPDIIDMAGGLTEEAYLPLGYINRPNKTLEPLDYRMDYLESFLNSNLTLEDTVRYNIDYLSKKPVVAVDFAKAAKGQSKVDLLDGDIIVIPENPKRVYVFGRVFNPGFVKFEEGMTYEECLRLAGGITELAEEDRIRIIRGMSNIWIEPDENTVVLAGDQIYVPGEPDIPLIVEAQQNQLYVGIGSVVTGLISTLIFGYSVLNN
ncbi:MAG: hypothetical protein Kapaf2KO_05080 [Candidatus Kapaibacteriales bacterium]